MEDKMELIKKVEREFNSFENFIPLGSNEEAVPYCDSFKATAILVMKGNFTLQLLLSYLVAEAYVLEFDIYSVKEYENSYVVYVWGNHSGALDQFLSDRLKTVVCSAYDGEDNECGLYAFNHGVTTALSSVPGVKLVIEDDGDSEEEGCRAITISLVAEDGNAISVGGGAVPKEHCREYLCDYSDVTIRVRVKEEDMLHLALDVILGDLAELNPFCELSHSCLSDDYLNRGGFQSVISPRGITSHLSESEQECFLSLLSDAVNDADACEGEIVGFDYDYDMYEINLTYHLDVGELINKSREAAASEKKGA